jgi:hypothetical protein
MNKINDENNVFGPDELVMYKEGDNIKSAGYTVNSLLMKGGHSPITSYFKGGTLESRIHDNSNSDSESDSDSDSDSDLDKEEKKETKGKDPFLNLAIPAGIMLIVQQPNQSEYEKKSYANDNYRNCDMLSDDIYDKLFEFASFKQKRKEKEKETNTNKKTTRTNNKTNELPKKLTKRKRP